MSLILWNTSHTITHLMLQYIWVIRYNMVRQMLIMHTFSKEVYILQLCSLAVWLCVTRALPMQASTVRYSNCHSTTMLYLHRTQTYTSLNACINKKHERYPTGLSHCLWNLQCSDLQRSMPTLFRCIPSSNRGQVFFSPSCFSYQGSHSNDRIKIQDFFRTSSAP